MTQPLVKRVLIHGGATTSEYSVDSNPAKLFSKFASEADCDSTDSSGHGSLICLQGLETSTIEEISDKFITEWKPSIDGVNVIRNPIEAIEFVSFLYFDFLMTI
jgi:hypothetical protein